MRQPGLRRAKLFREAADYRSPRLAPPGRLRCVHPARRLLTLSILLTIAANGAVSPRFQDAIKARIEKGFVAVGFADGTRTMVPVASLGKEDLDWLTELSQRSPLAHGKSEVVVAKTVVPVKKTVQVAKTEGGVETVQLCPPNLLRDQLGATCMLYGRVHWLDIAGFYIDTPTLHRLTNSTDADHPWTDAKYLLGLEQLVTGFTPKPILHRLPPQETDPFEWARGELRKGRPILASFPKEIWQALPPGFIAAHPWGGGSVGHQVVVNGFTWNPATKSGTFHIVNSWSELPEFDLKTEAAKGGAMLLEQSLSPKGEPPPETVKEVVRTITLLRPAGRTNLYEVETNLGTRRIAATSEEAARALIEDAK
jgi:hypothetical protein